MGLLQLASDAVLLRSASVPETSFPISTQGSCPVLDCYVGRGELQLPKRAQLVPSPQVLLGISTWSNQSPISFHLFRS